MTSQTLFFFIIPTLAVILLLVNLVFSPHNPYEEKNSAFECGFHSFTGQNRQEFGPLFFVYGLAFLIFDLEVVVTMPFAPAILANDYLGLGIVLLFLSILTVGFVYEIGSGALLIQSKQTKNQIIPYSVNKYYRYPLYITLFDNPRYVLYVFINITSLLPVFIVNNISCIYIIYTMIIFAFSLRFMLMFKSYEFKKVKYITIAMCITYLIACGIFICNTDYNLNQELLSILYMIMWLCSYPMLIIIYNSVKNYLVMQHLLVYIPFLFVIILMKAMAIFMAKAICFIFLVPMILFIFLWWRTMVYNHFCGNYSGKVLNIIFAIMYIISLAIFVIFYYDIIGGLGYVTLESFLDWFTFSYLKDLINNYSNNFINYFSKLHIKSVYEKLTRSFYSYCVGPEDNNGASIYSALTNAGTRRVAVTGRLPILHRLLPPLDIYQAVGNVRNPFSHANLHNLKSQVIQNVKTGDMLNPPLNTSAPDYVVPSTNYPAIRAMPYKDYKVMNIEPVFPITPTYADSDYGRNEEGYFANNEDDRISESGSGSENLSYWSGSGWECLDGSRTSSDCNYNPVLDFGIFELETVDNLPKELIKKSFTSYDVALLGLKRVTPNSGFCFDNYYCRWYGIPRDGVTYPTAKLAKVSWFIENVSPHDLKQGVTVVLESLSVTESSYPPYAFNSRLSDMLMNVPTSTETVQIGTKTYLLNVPMYDVFFLNRDRFHPGSVRHFIIPVVDATTNKFSWLIDRNDESSEYIARMNMEWALKIYLNMSKNQKPDQAFEFSRELLRKSLINYFNRHECSHENWRSRNRPFNSPILNTIFWSTNKYDDTSSFKFDSLKKLKGN